MQFVDLARRTGRTLGRDLGHAVARGPDEPPPLLRRVREAPAPLLVTVLLVVAVVGWVLLAPLLAGLGYLAHHLWWSAAMALTAGLLVLLVYRPLLAWRLAWLGLLYELAVAADVLVGGGRPVLLLVGLQFLVFLAVLLTVAASQRAGVVFWVWLLSAGLLGWTVPFRAGAGFRHLLGPSVGESLEPLPEALDAVPATLLAVVPVTAVVLVGYLTRHRTRAQRRLAVAEEHQLVLAERARIARELHDVIAHHMSMVAVRAETAPYRLRTVPEPAREEFRQISYESRGALTEMRRLLGVLRSDQPAPLTAPQPGLTDLADLVESARAAGATVTLEMHGAMTGLPPAVDVSGYRIVQEALTNAARHAAGAPVRISLRRTDAELTLSVRNLPIGNLPGRNPPGRAGPRGGTGPGVRGTGHGVRGMRERVAALGGRMHAGPTDDGGFEVSATLPLTGTGLVEA